MYVSLAEAEAYARWARARIMTEAEYQQVVAFVETVGIPSVGATAIDVPIKSMDSGGWEWTRTPFQPFPGPGMCHLEGGCVVRRDGLGARGEGACLRGGRDSDSHSMPSPHAQPSVNPPPPRRICARPVVPRVQRRLF